MWKLLGKSTSLYIKFNQGDRFEVLLTDFVHLWSTSFTKSDFIHCLKKSNPLIEFKDEYKLMQRGIDLFSNPEQLESIIKLDENISTISVSLSPSNYIHFKFSLQCELLKQNEENYFKHITQPLLRTIKDLRTSENKLKKMVIDKDKEISKYKVQNVDMLFSRKTDTFDHEAHSSQHNLYEHTFGETDILDTILNKVIETPEKVFLKFESDTRVVPEEMAVKTEPETNTEEQLIGFKEEQETIEMESNRNISTGKRRKKCLNY